MFFFGRMLDAFESFDLLFIVPRGKEMSSVIVSDPAWHGDRRS